MRTFSVPANGLLENATGIVVPVFFPSSVDLPSVVQLVSDTVTALCTLSKDPSRVIVAMDGPGNGVAEMTGLCRRVGASIEVLPENKGKMHAARAGMKTLLERQDTRYFVTVDQDGDHFPCEVVNLIRAAEHISNTTRESKIFVIGQRRSLHRPMGFLRGELEEFVDRILLDALHYHAAVGGVPLRLEYATMIGEYPDFHSGFKLFSRETASRVFLQEPRFMDLPETCYYRHAVEAVMTVEAMTNGAVLGLASRSTFNEQPVSTFGLMNRARLFADMILWPCRRLNVPPHFLVQWMRNHATRIQLNTLVPQGKKEIESVIRLVLNEFPCQGEPSDVITGQPLFL